MILRAAKISDSPSIAKIQVDSDTTASTSILPPAYLAHFTEAEQEADWRDLLAAPMADIMLVAEDQRGQVIGYALGRRSRDQSIPFEGELIALHVSKQLQKLQIGTQLFAAVCAKLRQQGCQSVFLWVLEQNTVRSFYEKLGGELISRKRRVNNAYFGTDIYEVAYGWQNIQTLLDLTS